MLHRRVPGTKSRTFWIWLLGAAYALPETHQKRWRLVPSISDGFPGVAGAFAPVAHGSGDPFSTDLGHPASWDGTPFEIVDLASWVGIPFEIVDVGVKKIRITND